MGKPADVNELLLAAIQREGASVFLTLLRQRAQRANQLPETVRSLTKEAFGVVNAFYREVRSKGISVASQTRARDTYTKAKQTVRTAATLPSHFRRSIDEVKAQYAQLPTKEQQMEFCLKLAIYSTSYLGGLAIGLQLPGLDLKLRQAKGRLNALTLHNVPRLSVEIGVEWLKIMLAKVREDRRLSPLGSEQLKIMELILANLSKGLGAGTKSQRLTPRRFLRRVRPSLSVSLDDRAYAAVERAFAFLSQRRG